jgi:hypothetical protein
MNTHSFCSNLKEKQSELSVIFWVLKVKEKPAAKKTKFLAVGGSLKINLLS